MANDTPGFGNASAALSTVPVFARGEWSGATRCAPVGAASPASITTSCASRCSKSGPAVGIARVAPLSFAFAIAFSVKRLACRPTTP